MKGMMRKILLSMPSQKEDLTVGQILKYLIQNIS